MRKPRWMTKDDWSKYQEQKLQFDKRLLGRLQQELAETHADLNSDDTVDLKREHYIRSVTLHLQLDDINGVLPYQQKVNVLK